MSKRVMVLSASAGSGHVRAAQAIEEACRVDERVSDVLHIDALEYTNRLFHRIYSKGYLDAVKAAPELWSFAFDMTDKPWKTPKAVSFMHWMNARPLVRKILSWKPDICVCTHGMPAQIISDLIQRDRLHTNLGIVVTDYYVHALWLLDIFTRYFVPKEESKAHLCYLGIPPDRTVVSGIPVLDAFSARTSKAALQAKHGVKPGKPLVILSAGAFGVMPADDIGKILEQIKTPCQIVVICGKNEKLKKGLEAVLLARRETAGTDYSIIGYTDAMHEYLKLADLFIGKPGGLSTSECLVSGVPMIVWDPIPGQELYNSYHILENGAGVMPNNAITIGFKVDQILSDPERLQRMSAAALAMAAPKAAKTIVDAMLENPDETPVKAFKKRA